jgi:hypothetical protein
VDHGSRCRIRSSCEFHRDGSVILSANSGVGPAAKYWVEDFLESWTRLGLPLSSDLNGFASICGRTFTPGWWLDRSG